MIKVVKYTYQDSKGNLWEVEKVSLPKKKGNYNFYLAECKSLGCSFREPLKRDIIKRIKSN